MGGHFNFDGDKLKTNIQMSFQKVFLNSQLQEQLGKSVVKSKSDCLLRVEQSYTVFFLAKSHGWTKQDYFLKVIFWQYSQR